MTTPLVLAVLALLLAGPVPWAMARLPWLRRTPAAAMLLWQAVTLAAVLAALGAGLSLVTDRAQHPSPVSVVLEVAAGALTLVVLVRLVLSGHRVGVRVRALRRRQRALVDVLARRQDGVHVVEHEQPMAYCLPGLRGARVVLTEPVARLLAPEEVGAVLAHERAHLRFRHDLVLEAYTVLDRAFPRLVTSRGALGEVRLLVEVLADRAAVRRHGGLPLARALVRLSSAPVPDAALAAGGTGLLERVRLLDDDRPRRLQAALLVASSLAVLVLPTVLVAWPWLRDLARLA